jgi:DNA-binding XRE family transcriptional regulator
MASRNDEKRRNDEFVALYRKSGMTQPEIAEAIGVFNHGQDVVRCVEFR